MAQAVDFLNHSSRNLKVSQDKSTRAIWVEFRYQQHPCFSISLLDDVWKVQRSIKQAVIKGYQRNDPERILYTVLASTDRKIFSLGGDLNLFIDLIENKDSDTLRDYARRCIEIQFAMANHYHIPYTNIALVEGEALGGGFEAALAANVFIAERGARFGFPEITFGMFPGMGALSFLVRKISPGMARRLIMDHKIYTATELYEMGIIDVLVPDGEGRNAVSEYMLRHIDLSPGHHGFQAAVDRANPVSYEELEDIVEYWVEAGMQLSEKNLRLMKYFSRAQAKRSYINDVKLEEVDDKYA